MDSDVDIDEFFGRYINFAYSEVKDARNTKTVIYAEARYEKDVTKILYDDIKGYNEGTKTLSYYDGLNKEKVRTKTANSNAYIVLNGQPYDKGIKAEIDRLIDGTRKGDVTYISADGSSTCDLIIVTSYEIFEADSYTPSDEKFYSTDKTNTVCLDDYQNCYIFDTTGIALAISSLSTGPFMIAASDNKESITIVVCTKKVEGTLSAVNPTEKLYTIGDEEYKADKAFYEKNKDALAVGASYRIWLDMYDEIVEYATLSTDGMKTGFLTKAALVDNVFDKNIRLRIYTRDDNTMKDFELASKVEIDGTSYKSENYKDIAGAFPGKTEVSNDKVKLDRQVIRYKLNKDGCIDKIDTTTVSAAEDKDNTLHAVTDGAKTVMYTWYAKCYGMNVYAASTTSYMTVPKVDDAGEIVVNGNVVEDTARLYSNSMSPEDWGWYTIEAFKYSSETVAPDLILVHRGATKTNLNQIMFNEIITGLDSEGCVVRKLTGISAGANVELELDETVDEATINSLKTGDILVVQVGSSDSNLVYKITKTYDAATNSFESYSSYTDPDRYWLTGAYDNNNALNWRNGSPQLTRAYAYDVKNGVVAASYTLPMAHDGVISQMMNCSSVPVTIYDKSMEKNQIYTGSISDIVSYKSAGENCDIVLLNTTNSIAIQLFVIKQ